MSTHFLLSSAAKTLTLIQVMRMTDAEAETAFRKVRWPETNGEPYCPKAAALLDELVGLQEIGGSHAEVIRYLVETQLQVIRKERGLGKKGEGQ